MPVRLHVSSPNVLNVLTLGGGGENIIECAFAKYYLVSVTGVSNKTNQQTYICVQYRRTSKKLKFMKDCVFPIDVQVSLFYYQLLIRHRMSQSHAEHNLVLLTLITTHIALSLCTSEK